MNSTLLVFLPVVELLRGLPVAILVVALTIWPRGVCSAADERKPFEGADSFEELNQLVVDKLNASDFAGIQDLLVPKEMFRPPLGPVLGPGREYDAIRVRVPELAAKFTNVLKRSGQMPLKDPEFKRENDHKEVVAGRTVEFAQAMLQIPGKDRKVPFSINAGIDGHWYLMFVSDAKTLGDVPKFADTDVETFRRTKKPPEGYTIIKSRSKLLPGMPLRHLEKLDNVWQDSEFVAMRDKNIAIVAECDKPSPRFPTARLLVDTEELDSESIITVANDVMMMAREDPEAFQTSYRLLPKGTKIIPEEYEPVPDDVTLVPGTPIRYEFGTFRPAIILKALSGKKLEVFRDLHRTDKWVSRDEIIVAVEVLDVLKKPNAETFFVAGVERANYVLENVNRFKVFSDDFRLLEVTDYGVPSQMLPQKGYERLKMTTPVPAGTPLKITLNWEWHDMTAVTDSKPPVAVLLRWADPKLLSNHFERDTIYIEKDLQSKLLEAE